MKGNGLGLINLKKLHKTVISKLDGIKLIYFTQKAKVQVAFESS